MEDSQLIQMEVLVERELFENVRYSNVSVAVKLISLFLDSDDTSADEFQLEASSLLLSEVKDMLKEQMRQLQSSWVTGPWARLKMQSGGESLFQEWSDHLSGK